jgi:hypothetical protein
MEKLFIDLNREPEFKAMTLREHPLMSRNGISNWPPVWIQARDGRHTLRGEIGKLRELLAETKRNRSFLVIEHNQERYVGALFFDDNQFCCLICQLLHSYIGHSIKEIGALDLSSTL